MLNQNKDNSPEQDWSIGENKIPSENDPEAILTYSYYYDLIDILSIPNYNVE